MWENHLFVVLVGGEGDGDVKDDVSVQLHVLYTLITNLQIIWYDNFALWLVNIWISGH